jgi:hypothetical protein
MGINKIWGALFLVLGSGLGVGLTYSYFNGSFQDLGSEVSILWGSTVLLFISGIIVFIAKIRTT